MPGHHESRNQNAEDALEIEDVCHTLKSSSASVGARALTTMCKDKSKSFDKATSPIPPPVYMRWRAEHARVCQALAKEKLDAA